MSPLHSFSFFLGRVSGIRCRSLSRLLQLKQQHVRQFNTSPHLYGVQLLMPAYSPTMTEGSIVKWLKKEGDALHPGDVICELKTDKAVVAFEADDEAVLAKIVVAEGTTNILVGTMIGMLATDGEDWRSVAVPSDTTPTVAAPSPPVGATAERLGQGQQLFSGLKFGPSVRKLLEEYAVSAGSVSPGGPHGTLLKSDVLEHITRLNLTRLDLFAPIESRATQPTPALPETFGPRSISPQEGASGYTDIPKQSSFSRPTSAASRTSEHLSFAVQETASDYTDIPVTAARSALCQQLALSKANIPHVYSNIECSMTLAMRVKLRLRDRGVVVMLEDFILRATALCLEVLTACNVVWENDRPVEASTVDICLVLDSPQGLVYPTLKSANLLNIEQVAATVKDLTERAKKGLVKAEECQGGTFSFSSLGMYHRPRSFTAIITPPQTAILTIGGSQVGLDEDHQTRTWMQIQLCHDARAIDDIEAARFLSLLRELLQLPDATCTTMSDRAIVSSILRNY